MRTSLEATYNILANKDQASVYILENNPLNATLHTNERDTTLNTLHVMIYALQKHKGDLTIRSTSLSMILKLTRDLWRMEDLDWMCSEKPQLWKMLLHLAQSRGNILHLRYLDPKEDNSKLALKALQRLQKNPQRVITPMANIKIPSHFENNGVRLQSLAQKQAFTLLLRKIQKNPSDRPLTRRNLDNIKQYYQDNQDTLISDKEIWMSQKQKWIPHVIQDFIWKITHNALKCGDFFRHIPNLEHHKNYTCSNLETPTHILLECNENHIPQTWTYLVDLLKKIDEKTGWRTPNIHEILTPGILKIAHEKRDMMAKEKMTLYQTLVMETTWMLWKERNNRTFNQTRTTTENLNKTLKETIIRRIKTEYAKI